MASRLLVALIGIPLLLGVLIFSPPIGLAVAIGVLSAIGVYELLWQTGYVKHFVLLLVIADEVRCNQNSLAYRISAWGFPLAFTAAIPSACRWRIDSRSVCAK